MPPWEHYYVAQSLHDALQTAANAPGPARYVAGGTDLLLDIQQGRHPPVHTLVDVTELEETRALEIRDNELFIGAAVPLSRIVTASLVREHAQALSEAAALIGGSQVRNTATLGGNVCHALPAADGAIALTALNARVEVAGGSSCRQMPLSELFLGPGKSTLDPRADLLLGFWLPLRGPTQASAHRRVMRPQGVAIAILNMGIWVDRAGDIIRDVRIALGPAGPVPTRARKSECFLRGREFNSGLVENAVDILLAETSFRTSPHRAGAEYRRGLAGVMLVDTFQVAWDRALPQAGNQR